MSGHAAEDKPYTPYAQLYLTRLCDNEEGLVQLNLCARCVDDACVAELVAAMASNTHVARIILNDNVITDVGVDTVAEHLRARAAALGGGSGVCELQLCGNAAVTDEGAAVLAETLRVDGSLCSIDLSRCPLVTDEAKAVLAAAAFRNTQPCDLKRVLVELATPGLRVRSIDLSGPPCAASPGAPPPAYTLRSAELLADALKTNATVVCLDLSRNNRGDAATALLAAAVGEHPTLQELALRSNAITDKGAKVLAASLKKNAVLFELDLSDNVIGDAGADLLMQVVHVNSTLANIVLDLNNISPEKKSQVVHSLLLNSQPPKLKRLYESLVLDSSRVACLSIDGASADPDPAEAGGESGGQDDEDGEGAAAAAAARPRKHLNDISCRVLSHCLNANTTVRRLSLPHNRIRDEGAGLLALLLSRNKTITKVDLRGNLITQKGAEKLTEALVKNTSVVELLMGAQVPEPIPEAALRRLDTQLALNIEPLALKRMVPLLQADDPSVTIVDLTTFDTERLPSLRTCSLLETSLRGNTHVRELTLSHNPQIPLEGLRIIFELVQSGQPPIETLRLASMRLTDAHAPLVTALINHVPTCALRTLDLSDNQFSNISAWVQGLLSHNHTLTDLVLTGSVAAVNPSDLRELGVVLKINAQPRRLKQIFLRAYSNDPTLKEIDLVEYEEGRFGGSYAFSRRYTDGSAKLLCDALRHNRHVKRLNMARNRIGDPGARAIADMLLTNRAINTINLSHNYITDEGFKAIGSALLTNPCVSCLLVDGNAISDPSTRKHLNLATGHNNAAPPDLYGTAASACEEGSHAAARELEAAIGQEALRGYSAATHGGGIRTLRAVMAKYNKPLYTAPV